MGAGVPANPSAVYVACLVGEQYVELAVLRAEEEGVPLLYGEPDGGRGGILAVADLDQFTVAAGLNAAAAVSRRAAGHHPARVVVHVWHLPVAASP